MGYIKIIFLTFNLIQNLLESGILLIILWLKEEEAGKKEPDSTINKKRNLETHRTATDQDFASNVYMTIN